MKYVVVAARGIFDCWWGFILLFFVAFCVDDVVSVVANVVVTVVFNDGLLVVSLVSLSSNSIVFELLRFISSSISTGVSDEDVLSTMSLEFISFETSIVSCVLDDSLLKQNRKIII